MSYIQDNLMPNEKILFSARVHPAVFLPSILILFIAIAFFIYGLTNVPQLTTPGLPSLADSATAIPVIFIVGSFIFLLYSILLGLRALMIMFTTEFAVTNRRVIAKTGFIRRHTLEMLLQKIESVAVYQDILGRVLNFGTVTVTGTGGTKESFRAIVEPIAIRKKINQIIEDYLQTYGEYLQKESNPNTGG
jgi:uncharacterized membrane protein YdbT with pleckstrin-like domain